MAGLRPSVLAPILAVSVSACAGGLGAPRHATLIASSPAGAVCDLSGEGYASRVTTPERIALPREAAPITLVCRAQGHRAFTAVLRPEFNHRLVARMLLGSTLGALADLIRNDDEIYPKRVRIHMQPVVFVNAKARDDWFRRYRDHVALRWQIRLDGLRTRCDEDYGENIACETEFRSAQKAREREMGILDRRWHDAPVAEMPLPRPPYSGS